MNRRTAVLMGACAVLPGFAKGQDAASAVPAHPLTPSWEAWKAAFLEADGRVVDSLQMGASHSESQGYGLLLAASVGDGVAFDLIDRWTMANLAVRRDSLFAWRWLPSDPAGVPDRNNASDGDLFYAWALIRAAGTLDRPDLIARASSIARDLAAACIRPHPDGSGRLLFAPAAAGFQRDDGLIVNPSYYMPLAMRDISRVTGVTEFAACAADGVALLEALTLRGLIPDWIEVRADGLVPVEGMSDNSGYEALRAPLFAIWSGQGDSPTVRTAAAALAAGLTDGGETPTVMDRLTGVVLESSPDDGYAAIAALAICAGSDRIGAAIPRFSVRQPYYPATLHLMTLLAQLETSADCVPI